jgi:hypothetical protein
MVHVINNFKPGWIVLPIRILQHPHLLLLRTVVLDVRSHAATIRATTNAKIALVDYCIVWNRRITIIDWMAFVKAMIEAVSILC